MLTSEQVRSLLNRFAMAYPSFIRGKDEDARLQMVRLWGKQMASVEFDDASAAADDYIASESFAPTPADILKRIRKTSVDTPVICDVSSWLDRTNEELERWIKKLHDAGLPTAAEAKRKGMTYREWHAMVDAAGL